MNLKYILSYFVMCVSLSTNSVNADNTCGTIGYPGTPEKFFNHGQAVITGVINGYDPEFGLDGFMIYYNNPITSKSTPVSVKIAENGTFTTSIDLESPSSIRISGIFNHFLDYYVEPERTLDITFDWDNLLNTAYERGPGKWNIQPTPHFSGDVGQINTEIFGAPLPIECDGRKMAKDVVPSEAQKIMTETYKRNLSTLENYLNSHKLHSVSEKILRNNLNLSYLQENADYISERKYIAETDSSALSLKEPIDISFFDTWKEIFLMSDEWIIASKNVYRAANAIAFSGLDKILGAEECYKLKWFDPGFEFLRELGAVFTPEEEEREEWLKSKIGITELIPITHWSDYLPNLYQTLHAIAERNGFTESFEKQIEDKFSSLDLDDLAYNTMLKANAIKCFTNTADVPLIWQIAECGTLTNDITFNIDRDIYSQENVKDILSDNNLLEGINHPNLLAILERYFNELLDSRHMVLPDNESGKLVKEIISEYPGKMILLDFWTTYCGPCRANIESTAEMRQRNANNPDLKIIFVTGKDDSPERDYTQYTNKHLKDDTSLYLPASDFNMLRELFKIYGVPTYVVIDSVGKVVYNGNRYHMAIDIIEKYGVILN